MKGSKKTFFRPLMVIFVIVCSLQIYASQEAFLNMIGPTNVAVGKSAVRFNFNYSFNGTMLYGHSYAYETPPFYLD